MRRNVAVLLAASALSIPAYAADNGWYVFGDVGSTNFKDASGPGVDKTDMGFRLGGGYMFMKYVGAEVAYADFGKASATGSEAKASGEIVNAIGVYPFNDQWSIFARLGLINATVKVTGAASASSTDLKTTYGIGGAFNFNKNWAVRVSYDVYKDLGDSSKTGTTDVDMLAAGVVYKF
jgi:Outer membrane protein beta-barrel domain